MPEIKHQFTGGKMNKDLDERLVVNGEYRDAMNIQVSTSEGSEVGTVQNILGNSLVQGQDFISTGSICVGSIADEKNDALYYLIAGPIRDLIVKYDSTGGITPVFVDNIANPERVLKFSADNLITGINIIDDMLFWTDGVNEPRKINIERSIIGTLPSGLINTYLINNATDPTNTLTDFVEEKHITVIKKSPTWAPIVTTQDATDFAVGFVGYVVPAAPEVPEVPAIPPITTTVLGLTITIPGFPAIPAIPAVAAQDVPLPFNHLFPTVTPAVGDSLNVPLVIQNSLTLVTGDIIVFPQYQYQLKAKILSGPDVVAAVPAVQAVPGVAATLLIPGYWTGGFPGIGTYVPPVPPQIAIPAILAAAAVPAYEYYTIEVLTVDPAFDFAGIFDFAEITNEDTPPDTFKNKFPRFSYRYKYEDGEYSCFGPFTTPIFVPGGFSYEPKKAYNLGMENTITKITLQQYKISIPSDVVQVDLLYKESNSPLVYLIDNIKPNNTAIGSTFWELPMTGYTIKPNQLRAVLPENQLLRPYDNVPRASKAQELTANRIIYANYLQNYDISNIPEVSANLIDRKLCDVNALLEKKSLKSIRDYTLGISYLDKFNRQSPVFSSGSAATINIPIKKSKELNQVVFTPLTPAPNWATHFKVFVKETSNEYYNLAMDRVYEAKDGNVWLSFPSSDRNKVDDETFLILKKPTDSSTSIKQKNRYKILAIENEAPDFIKTKVVLTAESTSTPDNIFTEPSYLPRKDSKRIRINYSMWNAFEMPLLDIEKPISVAFTIQNATLGITSTVNYNIVDLTAGPGNDASMYDYYDLKLEKRIKESWLEQIPAAAPGATIAEILNPTLKIKIYKKIIENRPEFDGRFFVKILKDTLVTTKVISPKALATELVGDVVLPFYYLRDKNSTYGPNGGALLATTSPPPVGVWYGLSGKASEIDDWERLCKFGGTTAKSEWFIDHAHFTGRYDDITDLQNEGMLVINPPGGLNGGNSLWPVFDQKRRSTNGNGRGIWTATATDVISNPNTVEGGHYIDLSHSKVGDDLVTGQAEMTDFAQMYDTYYSWGANPNDPDLQLDPDTDFYGELHDYPDHDNEINKWKIGSSLNPANEDQQEIVSRLIPGSKFRFNQGIEDEVIYTILDVDVIHLVNFEDSQDIQNAYNSWHAITTSIGAWDNLTHRMEEMGLAINRRVMYRLHIDFDPLNPGAQGPNAQDVSITNAWNPIDISNDNPTNLSTPGEIQFVDYQTISDDDQLQSDDPAIWETEPKFDNDLDIYYEVDNVFPLEVNDDTNYTFAPIGSTVTFANGGIPLGTTVIGWNDNVVQLSNAANEDLMTQSDPITFNRPDGSCVNALVSWLADPIIPGPSDSSFFLNIIRDVSLKPISLAWYNCYSFANGVESDRIRDDFNQIKIDKGAKASSTIDEPYEEEYRKYGLIYSGIYNSNSGINNLNQFIQAEKITKDINPTYGSIQKLHARDTDLVTLCEDKCLRILSRKDALYNADGNLQLTATENVLGQTIPFSGEYGISTNPESFASESYRVYFTDKIRGAVMRLSKDGLTPISEHGMRDWFRDNLKLSNKMIGSHDDRQDEYNITLNLPDKTLSFSEKVRGWVSFKSFIPENAISLTNEYYTFLNGKLFKHHVETVDRNTFYSEDNSIEDPFIPSSFNILLNDAPGIVKSFNTLNYEGSQTKVTVPYDDNGVMISDGEYFNLTNKKGWYVKSVKTDQEKGDLNEFIEKEGKWFNYLKGQSVLTDVNNSVIINEDGSSSFDQASFAIQGIGVYNIFGCTDPLASNYDPLANTDDGSCLYDPISCDTCSDGSPISQIFDSGVCPEGWIPSGHIDPCETISCDTCQNGYPISNIFSGSTCPKGWISSGSGDPCKVGANTWDCWSNEVGKPSTCTEVFTGNGQYSSLANCQAGCSGDNDDDDDVEGGGVYGCTDSTALNYDPLATIDDGSCIYTVVGSVGCQTITIFGGGLEGCADVIAYNNGTSPYTYQGLIAHWYQTLTNAGYTENPDGSPITLQSVEVLLGECCGLLTSSEDDSGGLIDY